MDDKFRSRKFILACAFFVTSTIAILTGQLDSGDFVLVTGVVLGLYNAANSGIKVAKINKGEQPEE